jgi:hypothetical protein
MADSNADALTVFFSKVTEGLIADSKEKSQSIPVKSLRYEVDEVRGTYYAADYFKYLIYGRGPGKAPPVDKMLAWVNAQPETQQWKEYERQSLAYVVGQKIARQGTEIYEGKRPGIDLLGVMEKNMPSLLETITRNEVVKIATDLKQAIK